MTKKYEEIEIHGYKSITFTEDDGSGGSIPTDPANSDYQAYLAYVANGNKVPDTLVTESAPTA